MRYRGQKWSAIAEWEESSVDRNTTDLDRAPSGAYDPAPLPGGPNSEGKPRIT